MDNRPLTGQERARLHDALAPVLRDIQATGAVGTPADAEQVARLADQVQEWEIEELAAVGRSATWPECPDHPNSHPLQPGLSDQDTAVWRCPRSGRVISEVGAFGKKG